MGIKPKVTIKLVKCGNCGRSYNNPFTHVCKLKVSKAGQRRVQKKRGR